MLSMIQGEIGKVFQFTIMDGSSPLPLTEGVAVHLRVQKQSPRACVIVSPSGGRADYTTVSGDIFPVGNLAYTVRVTYPGGATFYTSPKSLSVVANPYLT